MASSAIFKEELMKNSLFLQRCTAALHCLLALAGVCATGPVSACPELPGATCNAAAASPAGQSLGLSVNLGVGNPINVINGSKYPREEDMPALRGVLGLEIVRYVRSAPGQLPLRCARQPSRQDRARQDHVLRVRCGAPAGGRSRPER
jgi:hypothetical protein